MNALEQRIVQAKHQRDGLLIAPRINRMPLPIQRFDDPFLPFSKAIIDATRDLVSLYMLDVMAYLALGGAGGVALERTIDYINDEVPVILDTMLGLPNGAGLLDRLSFGGDGYTVQQGEQITVHDAQNQQIAAWHGNLLFVGKELITMWSDELVYADGTETFAQTIRGRLRL